MPSIGSVLEITANLTWNATCVKCPRFACHCAMILSVVNCSMKMSVYERTDIDHQRAIEDSGVEWSNGREGVGGRGGQADGCERAPCMATTESISKGGSCWSGSRKQRQKAVYHHVSGDSGEGDGAGHRRLFRLQPLAFDRDAGRSGGASICLAPPSGGSFWPGESEAPVVAERPSATFEGSATPRRECCCR